MANEQPKLSFKLGVENGLPKSGIEKGALYLSKQEKETENGVTYDKRARLYYGDDSTTLLPISDIQTLLEGNQGLCLKGVLQNRGGMLFGEAENPFNHAIELGTVGKNELNFYEYSGIFNFYKHESPSSIIPCGSIKLDGFHGNVTGNVTGTADSAHALTYTANNSQVGSATNPVYFSNGVPVATTYSLQKSVPSDAVFTDTKVTSADDHYTPSTDNNSALSVDASGGTAASWGNTSLVTGVNLQRDSKGHVTEMTVDSVKMPSYSAGTGLSLKNNIFSLNAATPTTLGGVRMSCGTGDPPTTTYVGQIYFQIVN